MLNHALTYLKLGLSVIPLEPKGKKPLLDWKPYQSRLATEIGVRDWFAKWPDANLGVVTGNVSAICVVDLDGPEGLQSAIQLALTSPIVSISGRGKHLWFKNPTTVLADSVDLKNKCRLFPGLDIRAQGGYVVAPPSLHENGNRYRFLRPLTSQTLSTLPEFPSVLLKSTIPSGTAVASIVQDIRKPLDIKPLLEELKNGHVHNTLIKVLGKFRAANFSEEDTHTLIAPYALENGRPYEHLKAKIEEIWGRYPARSLVGQGPNRQTNTGTFGQNDQNDRHDSNLQLENAESLEDFLKTEEEVSWIVTGLLSESGFAIVVGLPETNKTWALMDLAIEASRGGLWMGALPVKKQKVLFIDQERFKGETKRRIRSLISAKGLSGADLPNLEVRSGTSIKIDLDQSYNAFRKKLEADRPTLVIVDSFATFHTKEENNRQAIQDVLERIKSLRNEFKCTFLFIHHENKLSFQSKAEGKEPSLAEMAGNIAIPAAAETVFQVRKRVDGSSLFYHTKSTVSKTRAPFEVQVRDIASGIEVKAFL